ncbi:MAG: hypothetical protein AAF205_03105 [Pseudomonadota bacterium]
MDDQSALNAPDIDTAEAEDPEFEAPPVFAEQDERRMHVRAYNHWASLLNGREFPAPGDLVPADIDDFGPNSVLLDFGEDHENPILRFIGDRLRAECDLEDAEIGFGAVPARSLLSRLTDHYFEIIANRAPIGFEAEFTSRRGNTTLYRGILMPLASDGQTIDCIYGVINWKEIAEPEIADQLALDTADMIASALETAPPADDIEDLLFGEDRADRDEAAPADLPADASLADRLAVARDEADGFASANERSRRALYRVLSQAWDFHLATRSAPEDYADMLRDAGLKVQARAPMTPVVKLIFGAGYDKARLTEFAAALAHAHRADIGAGAFTAFLDQTGGLKAAVAAERKARRADAGKPKRDPLAVRRADLRQRPAVQTLPFAADTDEEFVLVLARRDATGTLGAIAAVPHDERLVAGALKRVD